MIYKFKFWHPATDIYALLLQVCFCFSVSRFWILICIAFFDSGFSERLLEDRFSKLGIGHVNSVTSGTHGPWSRVGCFYAGGASLRASPTSRIWRYGLQAPAPEAPARYNPPVRANSLYGQFNHTANLTVAQTPAR